MPLKSNWTKLNNIHEIFAVKKISRIANRVVVNRYKEIGQEFVLALNGDNTTVVLPIKAGVATTTLPLDARLYFLLRNKETGNTWTEISMERAKELIAKKPEIDESDIANGVEKALQNCFTKDALPKINYRDPDNWHYFMAAFKNSGNQVMELYMALCITKFQQFLNAKSKAI